MLLDTSALRRTVVGRGDFEHQLADRESDGGEFVDDGERGEGAGWTPWPPAIG
ncbi:hypothetical protein [Streptomyces sp. UG1]|uniref:hypothetical protein n=1 Tax=Streptomyces sp. UG1 TaxID=3417652 RepID=UPI003CF8BA18